MCHEKLCSISGTCQVGAVFSPNMSSWGTREDSTISSACTRDSRDRTATLVLASCVILLVLPKLLYLEGIKPNCTTTFVYVGFESTNRVRSA